MERAPLPPHERTWRHPSEIGPSRYDVDTDAHGRPILLAAGTLAAVMLVAMIVAMTPRPADGPVAISATTKPALAETTTVRSAGEPQIVPAGQGPRLASFAPIPNAVAAVPVTKQNTVVIARTLPPGDDPVHVKTPMVTYRVAWGDVAYLRLDDDAIVVNHRGELIARIADGQLSVLVDG